MPFSMDRRFFITSIFVLLSFLPIHKAAAQTLAKVVVYGDSLTSGYQIGKEGAYAVRLQEKFEKLGFRNFAIVDMSVAGESTAAAYQRVNKIIARNPDIVIVALGADDALKKIDPGAINQYVGMAIAMLQRNSIGVVVLGVDAPSNTTQQYADRLDSVYYNLARYYKTAYVPNILNGVKGRPENNLADGYHPNGKGVDVMVENSYRLIGAYIKNVIDQKRGESAPVGDDAPLPAVQPVPEAQQTK